MKPARQYAAEILALPTSEREAALLNVPELDRSGVRMYLDANETKREGMIAYTARLILGMSTRAQRRAALAAVPADIRQEVELAVLEAFANRGRA